MAEPRKPEKAAIQHGYDRWSEIYDQEENPLIGLEEPVVHEALGDVAGLEVLDLGCGTGRHRAGWKRCESHAAASATGRRVAGELAAGVAPHGRGARAPKDSGSRRPAAASPRT